MCLSANGHKTHYLAINEENENDNMFIKLDATYVIDLNENDSTKSFLKLSYWHKENSWYDLTFSNVMYDNKTNTYLFKDARIFVPFTTHNHELVCMMDIAEYVLSSEGKSMAKLHGIIKDTMSEISDKTAAAIVDEMKRVLKERQLRRMCEQPKVEDEYAFSEDAPYPFYTKAGTFWCR